MLNLSKGDSLDLKKEDGSAVTKIRFGGGWDMADTTKPTFDLDLFAFDNAQVCYFNNKEIAGVKLDKDNLTGAGEGADENIHFDVTKMTSKKFALAINIYNGKAKGQTFNNIKNTFVEIEDEDTKKVLARYNVSADGGNNDSLLVGIIENVGGILKFTAKGEYTNGNIEEIVTKYKPSL
jgi:stress response protein SCP2